MSFSYCDAEFCKWCGADFRGNTNQKDRCTDVSSPEELNRWRVSIARHAGLSVFPTGREIKSSEDLSSMASIPASYKAIVHERFGPVSEVMQLKEVATEPLLPSHVRVKVHSAAINPIDWKAPENFYGKTFVNKAEPSAENPYRVGWDVAGVVVEVADNVQDFKLGDVVFAMSGEGEFGTLAEYFCVKAKFLALKPKNLDFDHAAGVPLASLTTYQALTTHAKLQQGERVLIIGGSSATGIFAVQCAKAIGAYVIATTSGKNVDFVKSLGVDEVIDYRTQKWGELIEAHSLDVLLDCGMETESWETDAQVVLKKETGRFVTLEPFVPHSEAKFGASYIPVITVPSGKDLAEVAAFYESGKVKAVIDSVFPLEKTTDAFARIKTGRAVGKVIVKVI
jgi:NADPH:quinone reductase-like Zn-dependent oxidoreductase